MSIQTHKIEGGFVVSDSGTWLPGVYDTEATAKKAAALSDEAIQEMWDAVLASGRDTASAEDVGGAA